MEMNSSKPKKQRKWHYTKPLHQVQKEFSVHLSADLKKSLKKRNLEVKVEDTVKVMRGNKDFVGKTGKITSVIRNKRQVLIEGITRKKVDGTERQIPFRPSNLLLIAIDEKDERRVSKEKTIGSAKKGVAEGKGAKHGAAESTAKDKETQKDVKDTQESTKEKVKKDGK